MGIGLSVSQSIIENHHGHLWATPNDGAGATFCFSLPTTRAHALHPDWHPTEGSEQVAKTG
jgi:signal transduction histidine kinase